jgi:hypothetical protein
MCTWWFIVICGFPYNRTTLSSLVAVDATKLILNVSVFFSQFLFSGDILTSAYITTSSLGSFHVTFHSSLIIQSYTRQLNSLTNGTTYLGVNSEDLVASSLIGWFKIWTLTWPHTGSVVVVRWLCITINNNKKRYNHLILIWLLHMCCYLLVANILQE